MADGTAVHIGENSPEHIAFRLMQLVMDAEHRTTQQHMAKRTDGGTLADRKYILDTYAECSLAVSASYTRLQKD